jgi:hypothetical protein
MSRRALFGLALLAACPQACRAQDLSPASFARLHALIKPLPGESKWAKVPWLTNLAEARKRASAEDRPLLLWRAGGGDVLGRA